MEQRGNLILYEVGDKLPEEVSWYQDPATVPVFVKKTENGIVSIPWTRIEVEERNQIVFIDIDTGERTGVVEHYNGRTEMGSMSGTIEGIPSMSRLTITDKELGLIASVVRDRGQEVPEDLKNLLG